MASSPPIVHPSSRPPAAPALDSMRFATEGRFEEDVCFALEGAPTGSTRTVVRCGTVAMTTVVSGRVVEASADGLLLRGPAGAVRLRALLPRGVSLAPLLGRHVRLEVAQILYADRPATLDVAIEEGGVLLLWARDGALPRDRYARGLALRASHGPGGTPRLAVAGPGGLRSGGPHEVADVDTETGPCRMLALRVSTGEASFVLLRER